MPVTCLPELFERQVLAGPDRVAVTDGDTSLTYGELDRAANRLARRLRRLGVVGETLVGVCTEPGVPLVVAVLAVLKAGAGYVPLDPRYPSARLAYLLDDTACRVVVGETRFRHLTQGSAAVFVPVDDPGLAEEPARPLDVPISPENVAYVIHTSGSTGDPKGVVVTHRNVTRLFEVTADEFRFGPDDTWSLFHSFAFDFSVWELFGAVLHGGRLVVVPQQVRRDPEAFLALLLRERVTVLNQTPSAFRQLLRAVEWSGSPRTALRLVVFGGEALDPALLRPWFARHGETGPAMVNMYGITETTVHVTLRPLTGADLDLEASPIGRPLADLTVKVLDERLHEVPPGTTGELYVGGPGLARGYLRRPGLTAERFRPDPDGGGGRLYRTGDLAVRTADGDLWFRGRADDQVKVHGFRIELAEVARAVTDHASVREAVVLLDRRAEAAQLVAYVVPRDRRSFEVPPLREAVAERLPAHMLPAAFVVVDAFPLTPNGKLDTDALGRLRDSATSHGEPESSPLTGTQERLTAIWRRLLGTDQVGVHDNFFALGGDSILAISAVAEARTAGLRIDVALLFERPTIAELAVLGADGDRAEPDAGGGGDLLRPADRARVPAHVEAAYPASAMQFGVLYDIALDGSDPTLYHDLTSVHIHGPLDVGALERALATLCARHEVLRTSFDLFGFTEPVQLVHRGAAVPVEVIDLDGGSPGEHRAARRAWWGRQRLRAIPAFGDPPLARCHVLRHADGCYDIAVSVLHALVDGWSFALLVDELLRLYDAELAGAPAPAPAASVPYREFVALEQQARDRSATREFWRDVVDRCRGRRLPRGAGDVREDGPGVEPDVTRVLPTGLLEAVRRLADDAGLPVKSLLVAAHLAALGRLTESGEVVGGLVVNGRPERAGADQTVGLFLNILPLPVRLDGMTWTDLAREVFDAERRYLPQRWFPVSTLYADAGPPYDVVLNYTDFRAVRKHRDLGALDVRDTWTSDRSNLPMVVDLNRLSTDQVQLDIRVDQEVAAAVAVLMADQGETELARMVADPKALVVDRGDLGRDGSAGAKGAVGWNTTT